MQKKVLIIEDNKSNQALLAGLLAQIGVGRIEVASTGEEGLKKVVEFKPHGPRLEVRDFLLLLLSHFSCVRLCVTP